VRRAVPLLLIVTAVLPAGAHSKDGIERLKVCGSSGCRTIREPRELGPLIAGLLGLQPRKAPSPARFFTLTPERTAGWPDTWPRYVYVPEAKLVRQASGRGDVDWWPLTWTEGAHERATRGMTPFPKPVSWTALHEPAPNAAAERRQPRAPIVAVAAVVIASVGVVLLGRRRKVSRRSSPDAAA
jgi:hypothetical protein